MAVKAKKIVKKKKVVKKVAVKPMLDFYKVFYHTDHKTVCAVIAAPNPTQTVEAFKSEFPGYQLLNIEYLGKFESN
jgi:hypothetical protein